MFDKQHFAKVLSDELDVYEKMQNNSYEVNTKITIGSEDLSKLIGNTEVPIDITKFDIALNEKANAKENKAQSNLKINYDNKNFIYLR